MTRNWFISGIAYTTGRPISIDELVESGDATPDAIRQLRNCGVQCFCEDTRTLSEMCCDVISRTLESVAVSPDAIDALVFAHSNVRWAWDDEVDLLRGIYGIGIRTSTILGVGFQLCSTFGASLRVALGLCQTGKRRVLLVLSGRARNRAERVAGDLSTVFGDGAASCLVSSDYRDLAVLGAETQTHVERVVSSGGQPDRGAGLAASFTAIGSLSRTLLKESSVEPALVSKLLATNGSGVFLRLLSAAAGIDSSRVHQADLARFGHVYGCDNLIGLKNCLDSGSSERGGSFYLVMGWSPHVVSGALLQKVFD